MEDKNCNSAKEFAETLVGEKFKLPDYFKELIDLNIDPTNNKNGFQIMRDIQTILLVKTSSNELKEEDVEPLFYYLVKKLLYINNNIGFNIKDCPKNKSIHKRLSIICCDLECEDITLERYGVSDDDLEKFELKLPIQSPYTNIDEKIKEYTSKKPKKETLPDKKGGEENYLKKEEEKNDLLEKSLFYINGREAEIFILDDFVELDFTGNILKKFVSAGGGIKRIYYHQILSIQKRDPGPLLLGSIEFEIAGMSKSRMQGQKENIIHFEPEYKEEVDKIFEFVNNRIMEIHNNKMTPTQIKTEESSLDKIKKAKDLLDMGALTQEEFDEIKEKCLKNI